MRLFLACLLVAAGLTACSGNPPVTDQGGGTSAPPTPKPYQTDSPRSTSTVIPVLTTLTLPTPTPILYTIVMGDTLSAIAQRYNISVDALLAANPGVQPGALKVGMKLAIPTGGQSTSQPLPTPAPLPVKQARCWTEAAGGLWCFALLQNDYAETLENLSAQFSLISPAGRELASQTVYGLLDILPAGKSMPLAAYFPPPMPAEANLRVQVLMDIRLLPSDTRYLPAAVENSLVSINASGRTAQTSGRVLLAGKGTASSVWVLATAYDADGNVVGVRRWESTTTLTAEAPMSFEMQVSSIGPAIQRVEFLVEARP